MTQANRIVLSGVRLLPLRSGADTSTRPKKISLGRNLEVVLPRALVYTYRLYVMYMIVTRMYDKSTYVFLPVCSYVND